MPSLNSIELIGRLGKEPETRFTPTGMKVTTVSLAVGQRWTAAEGSWKEQTEWVNIEAWERVAEVCQQYLHKGRLVFIEGRLKTDRYEEEGETRYFTKVVAGTMQMLERKPEEEDAPE